MSTYPKTHLTVNYLELPMTNAEATKAFYTTTFGWTFQSWGPAYLAFQGAGIDGGFDGARPVTAAGTGPLTVLYFDEKSNGRKRDRDTSAEAAPLMKLEDLEATIAAAEGCSITKPLFTFPGGRRFQFTDPNGNELAVWCE